MSSVANPRDIQYPRAENGQRKRVKGSKKCAECGFYFVLEGKTYEFPLMVQEQVAPGEIGWVAILPIPGVIKCEVMTDEEWYKRYQCCPNCGPEGHRRCVGFSNNAVEVSGCRTWFWLEGKALSDERTGRNRCVVCRDCSIKSAPWTLQKVRDCLLAYVEANQRMATCEEFCQEDSTPSYGQLQVLFGNKPWTKLCQACGVSPLKNQTPASLNQLAEARAKGGLRIPDEKILVNMRGYLEQHGGLSPSVNEWNAWDERICTHPVILRRWGTWKAAWSSLGARLHRPRARIRRAHQRYLSKIRVPTEHMLEAGRALFELLERPPTIVEWNGWEKRPCSSTTVIERFQEESRQHKEGAWRTFQRLACNGQTNPQLWGPERDWRPALNASLHARGLPTLDEREEEARLLKEALNEQTKLHRELEEFTGKRITTEKEWIEAEALHNLEKGRQARNST